jgi:hypothetical protein
MNANSKGPMSDRNWMINKKMIPDMVNPTMSLIVDPHFGECIVEGLVELMDGVPF